jgi:lipid II:glycine glycyltransferase (peptidoglycan interpeptide bridge formation enzyme)
MPHFTHVLGQVVVEGKGKPETRLRQRIATINELIEKLPPFDYFMHACPGSPSEAVAFQSCGFTVRMQGNFQIDCRASLESILENMNFKTRGHVRKSEKDFSVGVVDDPQMLVSFYRDNMKRAGRTDTMVFDNFPAVLAACRERDSGEVLVARSNAGAAVAMVFLVWGGGVMYYLLASKLPGAGSAGAANLLMWCAIRRAHERGLVVDLDGIIHPGQMRFFMGFGGQMSSRLIVTRGRPLYHVARYARQCMKRIRGGKTADTSYFT